VTSLPSTSAPRETADLGDSTAEPSGYAFGEYVADLRTGQLRRGGAVVALSAKSLEVLVALIRGRGQIVTKDELFRTVWPDTVVEENNLARHISTLRKTLDEKLEDHRYIVTVSGRGYRFVAPVRELGSEAITDPAPAIDAGSVTAPRATPSAAAVAGGAGGSQQPAASTSAGARAWSTWAYGLGAALVLTALGSAAWLYVVRSTPIADGGAHSLWQVTFDAGLKSDPTFSPDGRQIAYAADQAANADIWVRSATGDGEAVRLTTSPAHDWQPSWSPDGLTIAFRSERDSGGIYLVSAGGGDERRLTGFGYEPHWSPDGKSLLIYNTALQTPSESPRIFIAPLDGQPPRELTSAGLTGLRVLRAAWHPDNRVSVWAVDGRGTSRLVTMDADGAAPVVSHVASDVERRIAEADLMLTDLAWAPSGRAIYFEGTANGVANLWRVQVDRRSLAWESGPERLTTGAGRDLGLAVSPDGQRLAFSIRTERTRVWELPIDPVSGSVVAPGTPLTPSEADASFPEVSPSAGRMVYRLARPGEEGLWEWTANGSTRLLVAAGRGEVLGFPRFTGDGRVMTYLVAQTERPRQFPASWSTIGKSGATRVMIREADGRSRVLVAAGASSFTVSDIVPGGAEVLGYCREQADAKYSICRMSTAAGARPEVIAASWGDNLFGARLSPNGRWISFTAIDVATPSQASIYVIPSGGGAARRVTTSSTFNDKARWSVDGTALYFVSNRSGLFNVWRKSFDPDTGHFLDDAAQVTHFDRPGLTLMPSLAEMSLAVTADRLFLPLTESIGQVWVLDHVER